MKRNDQRDMNSDFKLEPPANNFFCSATFPTLIIQFHPPNDVTWFKLNENSFAK